MCVILEPIPSKNLLYNILRSLTQDEDKSQKKHKHKKKKDKDRDRDEGSKEKGEKKKKKHRKKEPDGENAVKNEMNELEAFLEGTGGNYEAFWGQRLMNSRLS